MCTLLLGRGPGVELAVSANRDEFLSRPADGPRIFPGPPDVLMPVDLQAGGTWLGVNECGLFVAITNRAGAGRDPSKPSRGLLVREALRAPGAGRLHKVLLELGPERFSPFHLVYADREDAFVTWFDGTRLERAELGDGVHVVSEQSFGAGSGLRSRALAVSADGLLREGRADAPSLRALVAVHAGLDDDPRDAPCVHADAVGYGTRSSFQLVLRTDGTAEALWTDGAPCRNEAADIAGPVARLLGRRPRTRPAAG